MPEKENSTGRKLHDNFFKEQINKSPSNSALTFLSHGNATTMKTSFVDSVRSVWILNLKLKYSHYYMLCINSSYQIILFQSITH